jgi:O-antigen/teichoic acid export membrane protein
VGYYNIALNLFEAIKSLPSAVVSTLFPNITKEFSKTGVSGLKNAFVGVQRKLMMITTPVAVLVIYWADQIILTLYGQSFAPSAAVLKVLMGAFLFISYTSSYHNIVYATEEHKIFLWLSPISQGLFALALWILCSKSLGLGPIGAALAIGVPYYVSFPFVLSCVKKKIGVDYPTSWLLYVAAGAIMWALTALLTQFVGGGILLKVIWSLVGLGSYAGFLFIVHEISGQDLTYFLYVFNPSKFMNYLKSEFR